MDTGPAGMKLLLGLGLLALLLPSGRPAGGGDDNIIIIIINILFHFIP